VFVIGGGPAGSMAAILLARHGIPVTLVEQHTFPRDKVCGECLSALAMQVLQRAGLRDRIIAAGAVEMTRAILHAREGDKTEVQLPAPMWGLSRRVFDQLLFDAARESGATIRQPVRCESICSADGLSVTLRDLRTNSVEQYQPSRVIVADGKRALLTPRPPHTDDLGLKAHFTGLATSRDAVQLFGLNGHYVGIAPIENNLWNLAMSIPKRRIQAASNLDQLFAEIVSENRNLQVLFRAARRVTNWLVSPLPRFGVNSHWPPGVIPIGNAAAAIEPIGGEGMGLALRSAELAAEAIAAGYIGALASEFASLWRIRGPACRAAGLWMSSPSLCDASADLLDANPSLAEFALRLIGK
jgi:2-polyprenyl-6-methoxyphenol hydroxylase-like FAD-dependent oxidoreductase